MAAATAVSSGDLSSLIDRLGLDKPVLVGHSLGTLVCLAAAADNPGMARGLVLLAGALRPCLPAAIAEEIRGLVDPIDAASPFFTGWQHCEKPEPPDFLGKMAEASASMPSRVWNAILDELAEIDLEARAQTLDLPCLIVSGGRDQLFSACDHETLVKVIPGGKHAVLTDCGHNMHWEDPRAVAREVESFLAATATV